jgi:excisionase family DNA binding protein
MTLLTTFQVATRLGISVRRVQALIQAGRLRATKVGRDWLITEAALVAVAVRRPGRPAWRPSSGRHDL